VDDLINEVTEDLNCPKRKKSKEEIEGEVVFNGEAMGKMEDIIDETMFGVGMSLKAKIEKDSDKFYERKQFKEKKEKLEEFFKTNIKTMDDNRKIMMGKEKI
jgi:hypothetical protein